MVHFTREELERRLRDADRARRALRRATRELDELGVVLLKQREDRFGERGVGLRRAEATREPTA